jgi:hypothetical protein
VTDLRRWKNVVMNHKYPRCEEGWVIRNQIMVVSRKAKVG